MPSNEDIELRERLARVEERVEGQDSILKDLQKKVDQLWWKMGLLVGLVAAVGGNASDILKAVAG